MKEVYFIIVSNFDEETGVETDTVPNIFYQEYPTSEHIEKTILKYKATFARVEKRFQLIA